MNLSRRPPPLRIALISTAPLGSRGSMAIHAELVRRSLEAIDAPPHRSGLHIQTVHLLLRAPSGAAERLAAIAAARWRARQIQADVLHWLDGSHAYLAGGLDWSRTLVTVHDLIPALQAAGRFPGVAPPGWAARRLIASSLRALRRAAAVCTVSQATAADLLALTGRQADAVVPLCLRPLPSGAGGAASPSEPFLLHVGHNGFYKNRAAVIAVFAALAPRFPRLQLRLAGAGPSPELQRLIASHGLSSRVHWHPLPSDAELVQLYRQAALLLFPSLHEGFGWPPLEAMAQGCPVVCSRAGSLPEVVGSAALSCEPEDIPGFIAACQRLLTQPQLRRQLMQEGQANLRRFSSQRMGEQLLNLYQQVHRGATAPPSAA